MPRDDDHDKQPGGQRQESAGGYEDPAQRPASEAPGRQQAGEQDLDEQHRGRWPARTLFVAVVAVLLTGLLILGVLGFLAMN
ncbi:hypothetical protein [Jiangella gansuensis]|uniref:hypothetical protein n=1 Tax=Jiangella gansuensis TaxID=281473 RepID=UPI00047A8FD0|nr:hypothetical protein [Jiangella gansuensis]